MPKKPPKQVPNKSLAPVRSAGPNVAWAALHPGLYEGVKKALSALPLYFRTPTHIEGIAATDVFGFNTALGSAIEVSVVDTLNQMRSVWDPGNHHPTYQFKRFSQSFPDVRLADSDSASPAPILMGIEVKGWFVLAKEAEPSFRYVITPAACNPQDLILIVPWMFDNVISGNPVLLPLFVEQARYAAEARNYYWEWERGDARGRPQDCVNLASHQTPYPSKSDPCSDKAVQDNGGNFGRVARTKLLKPFVDTTLDLGAAGIPIKHWIEFLKVFTDGSTPSDQALDMAKLVKKAAASHGLTADNKRDAIPFIESLLRAANQ